ncbi:MAG: hypothetical protein JWN72_1353, partial [Thermoleophilia bacterium]|nr:hypothetical protein [Thermoleophilia bacterium]
NSRQFDTNSAEMNVFRWDDATALDLF